MRLTFVAITDRSVLAFRLKPKHSVQSCATDELKRKRRPDGDRRFFESALVYLWIGTLQKKMTPDLSYSQLM
jgi:hypothetical protein